MRPSLVWFRRDLRLRDNPALMTAARRGGPVVPVFVWSTADQDRWPPGGASRYWLHQSLHALGVDLRGRGSKLILRQGDTLGELVRLIRETGAQAVFWSRMPGPVGDSLDRRIATELRKRGVEVHTLGANLLFEPETLRTRAGKPYQVFTPFYREALRRLRVPKPLPIPRRLPRPRRWPVSQPLSTLGLEPRVDWAAGIRGSWTFGEDAARRRLHGFLRRLLPTYAEGRDRPDIAGTSRLSPHLHFGEISPRQIWYALDSAGAGVRSARERQSVESFRRQIIWREFAYHLLHHFPRTPREPLRPAFARMPWRRARRELQAWRRGQTGYPIVDAAMRELWQTGWMHNRARMIAASFLVKDLLLPWQDGARWFWDTLVDADLANNTLGWQWVAGCGADAAPFFRIFNPVRQGTKFDPEGAYVRRYVPELADLPACWIHAPWEAPASELESHGVKLGKSYPRPIVDHGIARARALAAHARVSKR